MATVNQNKTQSVETTEIPERPYLGPTSTEGAATTKESRMKETGDGPAGTVPASVGSQHTRDEIPISDAPMLYVQWRDSASSREGWCTWNQESADALRDITVTESVGFLIDESEEGIVLAISQSRSGLVYCPKFIPHGAITLRRTLFSLPEIQD